MAGTNPSLNFSTAPALGSLKESTCFGGTPSQKELSDPTRHSFPASQLSSRHNERSRETAYLHHFQADCGRITAMVAWLFLVGVDFVGGERG